MLGKVFFTSPKKQKKIVQTLKDWRSFMAKGKDKVKSKEKKKPQKSIKEKRKAKKDKASKK